MITRVGSRKPLVTGKNDCAMNSSFTDGAEEKAALNTAFRILSFRDHGKKELLKKLKAKGHSHDAALAAVHQCDKMGYLDEEKVAGGIFNNLLKKGYGPHYIRRAIREKGIEPDILERLMEKRFDPCTEIAAAQKAMKKKAAALSREADPKKKREKACRFLYTRGFSPDIIRRVVDGH